MIKVLADKFLFELEDMLPAAEVELHRFDPRDGLPAGALDYDAFLTRTVIPVGRRTLDRFSGRLEFVGTASSGTDHVDLEELGRRGIAFADAAGCNARSVAEYVLTGLLLWCGERGEEPGELQIGIVGAGHAGGAVKRLLEKCGTTRLRLNDPPRARREESFESCTADEVLKCDVLTFHVPFTEKGSWPTRRWLDREALRKCRARLIVNTSRGGVVDEEAVREYAGREIGRDYILDVWEGEPAFHDRSAESAFLATPHIAGYSRQAKRKASRMVARALCGHFGLSAAGEAGVAEKPIPLEADPSVSLAELLNKLHPARRYEAELHALLGLEPEQKGEKFNRLRATFPLRDEFHTRSAPEELHRKFPLLEKLGVDRL